MDKITKRVPVSFYESVSGRVPVRDWLRTLSKEDRSTVGDDLRTLEYGWPRGMPLCRSLSGQKGLWEIRNRISGGRIVRIIFYIKHGEMVLLNGFEKKSQKTPRDELELAEKRRRDHDKRH